jgi:hypothetical protein
LVLNLHDTRNRIDKSFQDEWMLRSVVPVLIFIRLLPESVTQSELRKFVGRVVHSPWHSLLYPATRIQSIEITKITSTLQQSVEYHGIIDIEPAKLALKVIRKLHRAPLKGKQVEVRKYYQRSALRDRRKNQQTAPPSGSDRRRQDRRRVGLMRERVTISGRLAKTYSIAS